MDWKDDIRGLVEVADGNKLHTIGQLTRFKTLSDAKLAAELIGSTAETLDYLESQALLAVRYDLGQPSWSQARKRILALTQLWQRCQNWETSLLGEKEPVEVLPYERLLMAGAASIKPEGWQALLETWQRFANQRGEQVPVPSERTLGALERWLTKVYTTSWDAEKASGAGEYDEIWSRDFIGKDGHLHLTWEGQWTGGRWFHATLKFSEGGEFEGAKVEWSTGTCRPSTFMRMENVIGHDWAGDFELGVLVDPWTSESQCRLYWKYADLDKNRSVYIPVEEEE